MENKRIVWLDFARSFAMIYIVAYWHARGYLGESFLIDGSYCIDFKNNTLICVACLALFMFISGYFLAKYKLVDSNDVKNFYYKRFTRFYLLYAVSAITLCLGGMNPGVGMLTTTLTGISSYILPQPHTLWFFSMLMSFYIVTPLLNYWGMLTVIGIAVALNFCIPQGIDERFFYCFPMYCFGLVAGRYNLMDRLTSAKVGIPVIIVTIIIVLCLNLNDYETYLLCVFPMLSILYVSKLLTQSVNSQMLSHVAYASMCAYLFHRHIFKSSVLICEKIGYNDLPYWFLLIVFIITVIISFWIQKFYDSIIRPKFEGVLCRK